MTAGYGIGEAAISSLLTSVTGFTAGNVGQGKWNYLNQGKSKRYAILLPGPSGRRVVAHGTTEPWVTVIQIWERYIDDGTTLTNLEADVEAILTKLDGTPRLGDTSGYVIDSAAVRVGEAIRRWTASGGPVFLCQDITVEWTGFRTRTFS